jgi:hypothetical protein
MYTCTHCGESIAAKWPDPVVMIKQGPFHYRCLGLFSRKRETELRVNQQERERMLRADEMRSWKASL